MDFGDFGIEDAAIIGGILGFADEAIRDEQEGESESNYEDIEVDPEQIADVDLRLFCRENPELFRFLIKKTIEFRKKAEMQRYINKIQEEISTEIKQMEKDEDNKRCPQ